MASAQQSDSLSDQVNEIVSLAQAYVVQETVGPLRGLGRFIGRGLAAAVLIGLGVTLLLLALLRLLQYETYPHLAGNWSWLPYAIVFLVAVGIVALAASRITKHELANSKKGRA